MLWKITATGFDREAGQTLETEMQSETRPSNWF